MPAGTRVPRHLFRTYIYIYIYIRAHQYTDSQQYSSSRTIDKKKKLSKVRVEVNGDACLSAVRALKRLKGISGAFIISRRRRLKAWSPRSNYYYLLLYF